MLHVFFSFIETELITVSIQSKNSVFLASNEIIEFPLPFPLPRIRKWKWRRLSETISRNLETMITSM